VHSVACRRHCRTMPPVTYSRLLENGWTRHAISSAIAAGSLRRLSRGWYDLGGCTADELTAAAVGGRVGCLTGLRDHGVWVPPTTHPHLIVARWSGAARTGAQHELPRDGAWPRHAMTYDVVECLRQVLRHHDVETGLIVSESACQLGIVSEQTIATLISECPPRRAAQYARFDPRSESGTETRVRLHLQRAGYRVRPQASIAGVGRVDLLVGESLVIECDSRAHHTGEEHYRSDRARDLRAVALGYQVVRLTWEQVFLDWPGTCELLAALLSTRRYRRRPLGNSAFSGTYVRADHISHR